MSSSFFDDIEIPERRCRSVFFGLAEAFLPSSLSCTKIGRDFSARKRGFSAFFLVYSGAFSAFIFAIISARSFSHSSSVLA